MSLISAGNTLCKSGSIAVFGNVVYSGLLNDHLWHLGVPLFTRLVRAARRRRRRRHRLAEAHLTDVQLFFRC